MFSVYAARMAGGEDSGGVHYDPTSVSQDRQRTENGD